MTARNLSNLIFDVYVAHSTVCRLAAFDVNTKVSEMSIGKPVLSAAITYIAIRL